MPDVAPRRAESYVANWWTAAGRELPGERRKSGPRGRKTGRKTERGPSLVARQAQICPAVEAQPACSIKLSAALAVAQTVADAVQQRAVFFGQGVDTRLVYARQHLVQASLFFAFELLLAVEAVGPAFVEPFAP